MICNCVDNVDTSDISFHWKGETFNDNEPKNMEKKFIYDDYDEGGMKRNIPLLVTYLMLSVQVTIIFLISYILEKTLSFEESLWFAN